MSYRRKIIGLMVTKLLRITNKTIPKSNKLTWQLDLYDQL